MPSESTDAQPQQSAANRRRLRSKVANYLIFCAALACIAALLLPRISPIFDAAKSVQVGTQLQTIRSAIRLYMLQHRDSPPTLVELREGWGVLIHKTDRRGELSPDGHFGPYLASRPVNTITASSTVAPMGAGTDQDGWEYDEIRGVIKAVGYGETADQQIRS